MARIHTDAATWNNRNMGDSGLQTVLGEAASLGKLIEDTCRSIDNESELMNTFYIGASKYETEISTRQSKLNAYSTNIQTQVREQLEDNIKAFMQRSAQLLAETADLSNYKTKNTLGIKGVRSIRGHKAANLDDKKDLSFADFMPTSDRVEAGKKTYVKAFADLYERDYNRIKEAYEAVGAVDELFSSDEYMEYLLYQGQFNPINLDSVGDKVWRGVLNATIVVPIVEAVSGKDAVTGYDLTSAERWDQGVTGAVGLISMSIGGFGIVAKGAKGLQVLQYMFGHVIIDMTASGTASLTNEICQEFLPPEVSRLIGAGVGLALAWKMSGLYNSMWDNTLSTSKVVGKIDDVKGVGVVDDGSYLVNGKLKPNSKYVTGEHDYIYKTNNDGLITNARTDNLQLKTHDGRLIHNPNTLGKLEGDHAGHLIGDRFGGSSELDNLVSQAKEVNLSEYRVIENQWAKAIENGQKVSVDIDINYSLGGVRPNSFDVTYIIDGIEHYKSNN